MQHPEASQLLSRARACGWSYVTLVSYPVNDEALMCIVHTDTLPLIGGRAHDLA